MLILEVRYYENGIELERLLRSFWNKCRQVIAETGEFGFRHSKKADPPLLL